MYITSENLEPRIYMLLFSKRVNIICNAQVLLKILA